MESSNHSGSEHSDSKRPAGERPSEADERESREQLEQRTSISVAMQWVSRITTVGLQMVLPGVGGLWLDGKLGTGFVFATIGFAVGMISGVWYLLRMTAADERDAADSSGVGKKQ